MVYERVAAATTAASGGGCHDAMRSAIGNNRMLFGDARKLLDEVLAALKR